MQRIGEPSPDRVEPACPAFGECGGCTLQHLSYPAQLAHKRARVEAALGTEVAAVAAATAELGYRNKGKYVVGLADGALVLGAFRPRSHDVVDTIGCKVVAPEIDRMAARVRDALAASELSVYDERERRGQLRHVVIRSDAGGNVLVGIVTTSDTPRPPLEKIAGQLEGAHGVVWIRNDSRSGTVVTDDVDTLAGEAKLAETIAGVTIHVGATEFFQVNRAQAARLYTELTARVAADSSTRAIDLYCGVGGIAFALAAVGARVVGIERQEAAVAAANLAATRAHIGSVAHFVVGTAKALGAHCDPLPQLLVVNPPRRGLDDSARAAVAAVGPDVIAYVSCNPESLARDFAALPAYRLDSATVFDLMPGTPQVETLAIFLRRDRFESPTAGI